MRIGHMVTSYQQQALQQLQQQAAGASSGRSAGAQRANQARLTEAAKGLVQATKVRDGTAAVSTALAQAGSLVAKAQDTTLSEAGRKQLQADLTKALAAVDQGVKDQSSALADPKLANQTYQATSITVAAAGQLGTGASKQFTSVAELKKLDLSTASPEQLAEAAKVLAAAQGESTARQAAAEGQEGRIAGRVNTLQGVQDALTGAATLSTRQQRILDTVQALTKQQTSTIPPGSMFNGFG